MRVRVRVRVCVRAQLNARGHPSLSVVFCIPSSAKLASFATARAHLLARSLWCSACVWNSESKILQAEQDLQLQCKLKDISCKISCSRVDVCVTQPTMHTGALARQPSLMCTCACQVCAPPSLPPPHLPCVKTRMQWGVPATRPGRATSVYQPQVAEAATQDTAHGGTLRTDSLAYEH